MNVNVVVDEETRQLEVCCTNSDCKWTGTYDQTTRHTNNCLKRKIKCDNEVCHQVVVREMMRAHQQACPKQKISCGECGSTITRERVKEHETNLCPRKRISCPLQCGVTLPRSVWVIKPSRPVYNWDCQCAINHVKPIQKPDDAEYMDVGRILRGGRGECKNLWISGGIS